MDQQVFEDAHAVLLPAFDGLALDDSVRRHLTRGGRSVLLGETREEYVTRRMSQSRLAAETADDFRRISREVRALAGPALLAVDQEVVGIQRLQGLTPEFPRVEELTRLSEDRIEAAAAEVGRFSRSIGVNVFLAPVLDLATGENPWLEGRRLSPDPGIVGRIGAAYIRGVQSANVASTAKHFPGYHHLRLDPAIDGSAVLSDTVESFEPGLAPFRDAVRNDVEIIMMGPAIVESHDPRNAASLSRSLVTLLRDGLGFRGLILSDDLDAPAIARGRRIPDVAVDAIRAGVDLCLMSAGEQVEESAEALVLAVAAGTLSETRLAEAARRVRSLADRFG